MPSPFPGMNPYLEQEDVWRDFHLRMVVSTANALAMLVTPSYRIQIRQRLSIHGPKRSMDIQKHRFLEILDPNSGNTVTIIEFLDALDKRPGPHRLKYEARRVVLMTGLAHFVEIDLLRERGRMPMGDLSQSEYCVLTRRAGRFPCCDFWPVAMRDPLPRIPIPLRLPDPDVSLDLQDVLHGVYDRAGYQDYIYRGHPNPPLGPEDAQWAASLIPS